MTFGTTALLECFKEYFKANGAVKNILYIKGFDELCAPLREKGYEITPINDLNYKINGELIITDFNDLTKYWKLNKSRKNKK